MPLQHFYEETIAYLLAGSIPFCFVPHREREPAPKAEQQQQAEPKGEKQQAEQKAGEQQPEPELEPEPKAEKSGSEGKGTKPDASEVLFEQPAQEPFPREEVLFEQPTHSPPSPTSPHPSPSPPPSPTASAETFINEDQTVLDEADLAFLLRPGRWEKAKWWKSRKLPRWWWKTGGGKLEGCGKCGGRCRMLRVGKGEKRGVVEVCEGCGEGRVG